MKALIGLEDRREARRTIFWRALFLVGLFAWASLAAWWATFFYRSSIEVRDATLRAYAGEEKLIARDLSAASLDEARTNEGLAKTVFALAKLPLSDDEKDIPAAEISGGSLSEHAIIVRPEERARLRNSLHRKMIMLAGEGSVLIGLLFGCLVGLYRTLLAETLLRRQQESFVHSVTHELKSPLAGLRSLLQSLATLDIPKADRGKYLEMGVGEIDRLDQLIANILLSSRLDSNAVRPSIAEVDLSGALARLNTKKARQFEERGGKIQLDPAAPIVVRANQEAVETILENIVDNALKYSPDKPSLRIVARKEGNRAFVELSDNGIGLTNGDEGRIFQKFYRAERGEQIKAKGSGLGLFIARGLTRSLGGNLKAHSDGPGKGTTFTLELPA